MADVSTITVTLLDKDYQVACPPNEQEALYRAARALDARLREIRANSSIVGLERIAIMAALNLSYELQAANANSAAQELDEHLLQALSDKVDAALVHLNNP